MTDPGTALAECDTLMLDMDGTVLDLAFDNYVWKELIPGEFARLHGIAPDEARAELFGQFRSMQGKLDWYCLDHWSERLGLDILAIHRNVNHRIGFLPGARQFLDAVSKTTTRLLLVTNSHPDTLALKTEVTGVADFFDAIYSAHEFGYAKEDQSFWHALQATEGFDAKRTLFVDDTVPVLKSAATYGVGLLVHVTRPDTTRSSRQDPGFAGVESVADLLSRDQKS
ncbi:MAG: GMP/IMP nucleotidase [Gammaproteobacteria bacterium]|nr:GMP/IMP nucleotidase [Gammaproteobacteria bacterium]MDH4315804.1 GMP/IMP nucleotidase [Gammaproteobacteria bacterium]MDH5214474.1 GMP/IMP nucleotidase [Gammaproteobacteria bacterium]MDH5501036.1 GMP/IMP nucleotidase [Gammaproteobacteria bacterium]